MGKRSCQCTLRAAEFGSYGALRAGRLASQAHQRINSSWPQYRTAVRAGRRDGEDPGAAITGAGSTPPRMAPAAPLFDGAAEGNAVVVAELLQARDYTAGVRI